MGYVLLGLIIVVCLVGGTAYGLIYLKAKATKTSVVDAASDLIPKK